MQKYIHRLKPCFTKEIKIIPEARGKYTTSYKVRPQGTIADFKFVAQGYASERLMQAIDRIHQRHGRGVVRLGTASTHRASHPVWQMKQARLTPGYTTCWEDLAIART